MNPLTLIFILTACHLRGASVEPTIDMAPLIAAEYSYESSNGTRLSGDRGLAFGPFQIHQCALDDYNRINQTALTTSDVMLTPIAERVYIWYVQFWGSLKRLGRVATFQDYARIWNGGPNGYRKKATVHYWKSILARLNNVNLWRKPPRVNLL